ncbi:hypothetical protein ACWGH8_39495 [Nonomuraea muscovyensis]
MMRALAGAMLSLYPKAWRDRYGDEVADLIASRTVRLRTVFDLVAGAADAWIHRRRVPGAGPARIPLAAVLTIAGTALLLLWNPGVRDPASLNGTWAEASVAGALAGHLSATATSLFVVSAALGVLAVVPLLITSYTVTRHPAQGQVARTTARRVVVTALLLAVPVALVGCALYGMAFAHLGAPVGPLGETMVGGFLIPVMLALVLPLPTIAASAPSLAPGVRASGKVLTVAAVLNALAWVPVLILLALGLPKASWTFTAAVAAGALISVGMSALVARSALGHGRSAMGQLSPA